MLSTFERAFAAWRGDTVGPCKTDPEPGAPAPAADPVDAAFAEWEEVAIDELDDAEPERPGARGTDADADVDVDVDDADTEVHPATHRRARAH